MTERPGLPELIGGRYEVRDHIGSGGAATVYHVYDPVLRIDRALKLLHGQTGPHQQARLEQEARIMVRLDHPHVLRVFELGIEQGRSFVVMELADASLQDRLDKEGPLPPSEVVNIGIQVLSALSAAHTAGVIHRDIKPHNLLLCGGRVVLADFGIASVAENRGVQTRTGMMMGSLAYMPPEQRLDARSAGPRSDLYAVGSTLYALLTGGNPVDLFAAPPSSPRWLGIPPPLQTILQRACAYEPSDRYPDAAAMAAALKEAAPQVGELPAVAWPEVPPTDSLPRQPTSIVVPPLSERGDRRRWWPMLVLLALLSLPFLGEEEPVVVLPSPTPPPTTPLAEAPEAAPPPLPVSVEPVKSTTKKSANSVSCTPPSTFQGSWDLACGIGSGRLLLGEKEWSVTMNGETQPFRTEMEGGALRLWLGNSNRTSYIFNTPKDGRYFDGGGFAQCGLTPSVFGTWSGSYGAFNASMSLKMGGGGQVKGSIFVTTRRGGSDDSAGSASKNEVQGSFDPGTGLLRLEDSCDGVPASRSDCGRYLAQVNGARMNGTLTPNKGPKTSFSLVLR